MRHQPNKLSMLMLLSGLFTGTVLHAQQKPFKGPDKKWIHSFGFGLSSFKSNGILPSQNELNYFKAKGIAPKEERTFGFLYEGRILRKINAKNSIGISMHGYNDFRSRDRFPMNQNVEAIYDDSFQISTIQTYQSYLNIGLIYERKIVSSRTSKFSLYGSFGAGLCINRTPDRTEYDYTNPNGFKAMDTTSSGVWLNTATRFNNGFYLNPAINLKYNWSKNCGIMFELSQVVQWNSSEIAIQIPNYNSEGSYGNSKYRVNAQQLKLSFFF